MQQRDLPQSIVVAVNGLLSPYGTSIHTQLNNPDKTSNGGLKCLSPKAAAEVAGCSKWTIFRAIKSGDLPAAKLSSSKNGKVLVKLSDIEAWINSHRIKIVSNGVVK